MGFITIEQVSARLGGLHFTTVYKWVREGRFPKPVKLSPGTSRWDEDEVNAWHKNQLAIRDGQE